MQLPLPLADLELTFEAILPPSPATRVFCNRSLRLDQVEWVGFDMDYTLAIYVQEEMDRLSIEATAKKLVERGYPETLLSMDFRTDFPIRGLLIDRKLGNILKMDRYKYVKRAYHGLEELTRDDRRSIYHGKRLRAATKRYHWVDTLYGLCEVSVYAAAVQELERTQSDVDYNRLFGDVRECIDLAHRDGSIVDEVAANLERYVVRDPDLGPLLHKLRSSGKKLFLLTNSYPEYTEKMMTYLVGGSMREYASWRAYFDVVITAAKKPVFFTKQEPFLLVTRDQDPQPTKALERGKVYMGGNIRAFERFLGVPGDRVLYVGDHIYGDVLRAKKESAWRTIMIIQELDEELHAVSECRHEIERLDALERVRGRLHDDLREHQYRLRRIQKRMDDSVESDEDGLHQELQRERRAIDRIRERIAAVDEECEGLEERVDAAFHPFWGSLMKAGAEVSSFGDQIETYACLYTTKVSNLLRYSPMHYFRSPRDRMPHELHPSEARD